MNNIYSIKLFSEDVQILNLFCFKHDIVCRHISTQIGPRFVYYNYHIILSVEQLTLLKLSVSIIHYKFIEKAANDCINAADRVL